MQGSCFGQNEKTVRREWTRDDVKTLKTLAKQKAGVKKISKTLKANAGSDCREGVSSWAFAEHSIGRVGMAGNKIAKLLKFGKGAAGSVLVDRRWIERGDRGVLGRGSWGRGGRRSKRRRATDGRHHLRRCRRLDRQPARHSNWPAAIEIRRYAVTTPNI